MISKNKILRTIAAALVGEIALVLTTTFAQEILFNGISYTHSSNFDLVWGGIATFIAAIISGWLATYIGGNKNIWPSCIISIIIMIEMSYLILSHRTHDPLWFDILAGLSLIIGIWIGYLIKNQMTN